MKLDRRWLWQKAVWMGRAGLAAAVLAICLQPSSAQEAAGTTPQVETTVPPAVDADRAIETAERFVRKAWPRMGGDLSHGTPVLAGRWDGGQEWCCRFRSEDGRQVEVGLDAAAGTVRYAADFEASGAEGQRVKVTPEQALSRALSLLKLMGVDRRQIALCSLRLEWDRDRACQDWRATWERVVNGDRVGNGLSVRLNATSGELIEADRGVWVTGPLDIRVDRQAAMKKALEIAAWMLETAQVRLDGPPELRMVRAGGSLPTDDGDATSAPQPRMAWVVYVSGRSARSRQRDESIELWIDARSGDLLEGLGGRERQAAAAAAEEAHRLAAAHVRRETKTSRPKGNVALLVLSIAGMVGVVIIALIVARPRRASAPPDEG